MHDTLHGNVSAYPMRTALVVVKHGVIVEAFRAGAIRSVTTGHGRCHLGGDGAAVSAAGRTPPREAQGILTLIVAAASTADARYPGMYSGSSTDLAQLAHTETRPHTLLRIRS